MLQSLIAFAGAAVIIALVPGPSTVMILRQSVREGRRAGVASVLGNSGSQQPPNPPETGGGRLDAWRW
ncbi:MAG: Threonine/homoserine/homoserine lactone efflux protein [Actinomycetia bacterium]|nr:Threonine/homoserine/homoserine lactone efflux protein [Actinomycetes bacterium]